MFENYEFRKHLRKILSRRLAAELFFFSRFYSFCRNESVELRRQSPTETETLKYLISVLRLQKSVISADTAALNWHLKSYTESIEASRIF